MLFYMVFLIGVFLIYSDLLKSLWAKVRMHNRLKARRKALKPETAIEKHLRKVLSIALKKPMDPKDFIRYTVVIFLLIMVIGIRTVSFASAFLMSALVSAMPYLLLRVRVETIRRKSSYEGEKLISEFLCQYRMSGLNIYKTIEQVILLSEGTKITGRLLFKLLLELRNTGNQQVIKDATERFAYGINTSWSRMLANCIRISAESGINVTLALEDIQIQLREARLLFEERKRLNSEAARMVVFLAPVMYLGTIVMSVKYLGIPFGKLIRNQFYTEQGFLLILLVTFLFLINLALIEIINNQRFDY
jgi:Flp pilus assembly protein TadB